MSEQIPEDILAGPVCMNLRWRLHACELALKGRHLRAFDSRGVSAGLSSWARQHIEWTLIDGARVAPDGVVTILVDGAGRAVMGIEPYVALDNTTTQALAGRAQDCALDTVPAEMLWLVREGAFVVCAAEPAVLSGANSLVRDLAKTLGIPVSFDASATPQPADEVMLVSDEHGAVAASDASGSTTKRFVAYYTKLLEQTKPE